MINKVCIIRTMSHEFLIPEAKSSEEEKKKPRLAGSRTSRAIMLAAGMATLGSSADAEARKRHRSPKVEVVESRHLEKSGDRKEYPSLNGRIDHGIDKEVEAAEHFGLKNFKSIDDIKQALEKGELVHLDPSDEDTYALDGGIGELVEKENRHYFECVLPYVKERLEAISFEFYYKFRSKLIVNSAIRTEKYQDRLRKGNTNTAQGYTSSHLKGSTLDIAYFGPQNDRRPAEYRMTPAQQEWLDGRLLLLELEGLAQVTKEKQQPVYHIMFYPEKYKK